MNLEQNVYIDYMGKSEESNLYLMLAIKELPINLKLEFLEDPTKASLGIQHGYGPYVLITPSRCKIKSIRSNNENATLNIAEGFACLSYGELEYCILFDDP